MSIILQEYHNESIAYRKKKRAKADKILSGYSDDIMLSDMASDDLYAVLNSSEREQLALRAALEDQERAAKSSPFNVDENLFMKDFPISISYDGTSVTIETPPVLNRNSPKKEFKRDDYLLAEYVKAAFRKWKADHPEIEFETCESFHCDEKLLMIITRKALRYNHNRHVDNDNFECRRIQNVICSALFITDSCDVLSLIYHFEEVDNEEECGTEFKIGPAKYLAKEFAEKDFHRQNISASSKSYTLF